MHPPVILLAFANEREDTQRYLRNLPNEQNRIRKRLEKAEDGQLCEIVVLPNVTLDDLTAIFQRQKYRDRIAILHYGGHADSYELLLETARGQTEAAHGEGLVPFLAGQRGLKLVFLNGCHSAQQAQALIEGGVSAVIGTSKAIRDDLATNLAANFYRALGEGVPLEKAWQEAIAQIKAREGVQDLNRFYHQPNDQNEEYRAAAFKGESIRDQFPWELYFRPGAENIHDWNLPATANDPYFGLPDIPATYELPEVPYRFLARYNQADARIFFGRGNYIRDLYHRITSPHAAPVLLLYGQSGVGKSSLLEAGLFPRLENEYDFFFVRRHLETGLARHLCAALECTKEEADAGDLLRRWKELEANSPKKGFLIVLDQVEEVFTRPNKQQPDELSVFLQLVRGIFARAGERPRGKLLLSYRKEYDPEIEKACRAASIPKEKMFLDRLDRPGIIEIIQGLSSTSLLRNKYRLEIEQDLPVLIADDLLVDKNSPITPVLQIILTRLWQEEEEKDRRHFGIEAYNELRKKGIFLDDFFHQQMTELQHWEKQVQQVAESSGLALDVLHFHTTPLGTAESRNLEELRQIYQHQSDVLEALVQQFKSLYLLTAAGKGQSSLAHDTLAPVVHKELNESDKPGQRASRILTSKMMDYKLQPERTYIDEEDLALVEEGAGGMRMWTSKEQELIEKSRKRRALLLAERKRNRRLKIGFVIMISILALVASSLWWKSSTQASVNQLISKALSLEETDATQALEKVQNAWDKINASPFKLDDKMALQTRHDIFQDNEFYQLLPILPDSFVTDLKITANGEQILMASGHEVSIWNVSFEEPLSPVATFSHPDWITSAYFSKDEQLILTASEDAMVRLWTKNTGKFEEFSGEETFYEAVFSPDEQSIYGGCSNGKIYHWDREGNATNWQAHGKGVTTFAFDSSRHLLITGGFDSKIYIWDQHTKQKIDSLLYEEGDGINSIAYDADQKRILAGYLNGVALLWNMGNKTPVELKGHSKRVNCVTFSPDKNYFLTASEDQQIKLWDQNGKLLKTYRGHVGFVQKVDFSPDGLYFASAGEDKTVKWWKRDSKTAREFNHAYEVTTAVFSPDGQEVITADGYTIVRWNIEGEKMQTFKGHKGWINAAAVTPDGNRLFTGSDDGSVIVWDREGEAVYKFEEHQDAVYTLDLSPTDSVVASGGLDRRVLLWNTEGEILDSFPHPNTVNRLVFSPDGKQILTGCVDGIARLWERGKASPREFKGSVEDIFGVAFSPDGRYLAVSGSNVNHGLGIFSVWDIDGNLLFEKTDPINSNEEQVRVSFAVDFSSDSQYLMVSTAGGVVQVFDLKGRSIITLDGIGSGEIYSAYFSPDNDKYLLASSMDGRVRLLVNILKTPELYNNSWYK